MMLSLSHLIYCNVSGSVCLCNWAFCYQRTYNRMARDVISELPRQTHKYLGLSSEIRPVSAGGCISHQ